jgi:hypothetical protein
MKHIARSTGGSGARSRATDDAGQATAEYALVMLAAAGLAGSVLAWAVGTDAVGRLMDAVVEQLIGQVS